MSAKAPNHSICNANVVRLRQLAEKPREPIGVPLALRFSILEHPSGGLSTVDELSGNYHHVFYPIVPRFCSRHASTHNDYAQRDLQLSFHVFASY